MVLVTLGDASAMAESTPDIRSSVAGNSDDSSTYLTNHRVLHNATSKKKELEIMEEHRKLE